MAVVHCSATASDGELGILQEGQGQNGYLARGSRWGVRRMERVGDEMRRVAEVQAEAFHEPVALFNDFFFEFFKVNIIYAPLKQYLFNSFIFRPHPLTLVFVSSLFNSG